MGTNYRQERMNDAIRDIISELIFRRIKDPRIGFVTITSVSLASDYMTAKVYYSVMGSEEEKAATLAGLESAKSFMRRTIGKVLKLRHAPDLRFIYDDSIDRAMAIEEALKKIHREEEGQEET